MHLSPAKLLLPRSIAASMAAICLGGFPPPALSENFVEPDNPALREAWDAWRAAGFPDKDSTEGEALFRSAVSEGRSDMVEALLAGGPVQKKMLAIPKGAQRVPLHVVRTFRDFQVRLEDEMFSSIQGPEGWLARRITSNRIEVWTSRHGRLFDSAGRLLHEARPKRREGVGREWYGAFLPDGRWVTTDVEEMDGNLYFYSAKGELQRTLSCGDLARWNQNYAKLLGWARSDKTGRAWVVNVGSEEGLATVQIGPSGAARILTGLERWQLCYPRALGPRQEQVPDDQFRRIIRRAEASHGPYVGFPDYSFSPASSRPQSDEKEILGRDHVVPHGNDVFGFWPRSQRSFVCADGSNIDDLRFLGNRGIKLGDYEPSGVHTRKVQEYEFDEAPRMIIDKSWLFETDGKLLAWIRARQVGDAADGHSLLFRVTADSRIVTLDAELKIRAIRRLVWSDNSIADALILWDDLRLGLFVRNDRLVIARW